MTFEERFKLAVKRNLKRFKKVLDILKARGD